MIKPFLYGLQLIVWTGYATVELLSKRDELTAKVILFFVFAYLAYGIAEMNVHSKRKAFFLTCSSLFVFFLGYTILFLFIN
ncbi:hypothetical protein ACR3I8_00735 [Priestia flexa]|uniref:hypothetical protein n=1 Tax=Priestia flexa TaxID=86664 RepID=UPI0021FCFA2F|nr:hypothetical protein [Priestia flexa]MDT2047500.1 hypothetical protein [Priestia flexa]USY56379.1 hypothetical protein NIZ91_06920 [Bacillus sp. 1780r2a1]